MTSQEIIRKAVRIVAEEGYDRLTLSSLAQELGVSKAGIYHHFSSKEEIIDAIYTHYEADMLHLGFSVDFSRPADEVLSTALSHWRSIFTSPERSLFISMVEQRRDVDERAWRDANSLRLMVQSQSEAIFEHIDSRKDADVQLMALLFSSALYEGLAHGGMDLDDIARRTLAILR